MSKKELIVKLTSRKFWVAITNFVAMLLVANGVADSEVAQITAIIMGGAGLLAYILAEGWIDAEREAGAIFIEEDDDV